MGVSPIEKILGKKFRKGVVPLEHPPSLMGPPLYHVNYMYYTWGMVLWIIFVLFCVWMVLTEGNIFLRKDDDNDDPTHQSIDF